MTKERLQQYRWIKLEIKQLEERLFELENKAIKTTKTISADPRSGSKVPDGLAETVCAIADLIDIINVKRTASMVEEKEIERAFDSLTTDKRCLLRMRYSEGLSWSDICIKLNYSRAQIDRMHT